MHKQGPLIALLSGLLALGSWGVPAAAAQAPPAGAERRAAMHEWSPAVQGALAAYRAGAYQDALALCRRTLRGPDEAGAHTDAAAIEAMCLLRMPARGDRVEGRSRLARLMQQVPALEHEPECHLAFGIGQTALYETASALEALAEAAAQFAARGLRERQQTALVALARAWAAHTEWEMTPPRFGVKRPLGSAAILETKLAQLDEVSQRLAALPASDGAQARVRLVRAELLLDAPERTDAARRLLHALATPPLRHEAQADAALLLAEHYEQAGLWEPALAAYRLVVDHGPREDAAVAEARVRELTRPALEINAPATAAPETVVALRIRARGVARVVVEVRQVDLEHWLGPAATRGRDAALPVSGSVRLARTFAGLPANTYAWWDSGTLDEALTIDERAGAYVVWVRGTMPDGNTIERKHLLVLSDARAVACVGAREVLVWAGRPEQAGAGSALDGSVQFWMRRSFVPTSAPLAAGVARFALPNEAHVMTDRDWVCLVETAAGPVLCRGRLPAAARTEMPSLLMVAGPQAAHVGQTLTVSGLLVRQADDIDSLELALADTVDAAAWRQRVSLTPAGAFQATWPVTGEMAGRRLSIVAEHAERVLPNLVGAVVVQVAARDAARHHLHCDIPPRVPRPAGTLDAQLAFSRPWAYDVMANARLQVTALTPVAGRLEPAVVTATYRGGSFGPRGQYDVSIPLAEVNFATGPLVLRTEVRVADWTGWRQTRQVETLVHTAPRHAWLTVTPGEPTTQTPVQFGVGWLAPGGLPAVDWPMLAVRRDGEMVQQLALHPDEHGLTTDAWQPPAPGTYEAAVTFELLGGETLAAATSVAVKAADATSAPDALLRGDATRTPAGDSVHLRLKGRLAAPGLVLVADDEPRAVDVAAPFEGAGEAAVSLTGEAHGPLRAVLVELTRPPRIRWAGPVRPAAGAGPEIELPERVVQAWPGSACRVPVCVTGPAREGAAVLARLIDVADAGFVRQRPRPALRQTEVGIAIGAGAGLVPYPEATGEADPWRWVDRALWNAAGEGASVWTHAGDARDGALPLRVPVARGLYRLVVAARSPGGAVVQQACLVDARGGVAADLSVPAVMTRGDRVTFAARLAAPQEPVEVALRVDGGAGLQVESLRAVGIDGHRLADAAGPSMAVTLPAGAAAHVLVRVEAARVGDGQVTLELAAGEHRTRVTQPYAVELDRCVSAGAPALRIRRTMQVYAGSLAEAETLRPLPPALVDDPIEVERWFRRWRAIVPQPAWVATSWAPGGRARVGQLVVVREEIAVAETLRGVAWTQRLPACCGRVAPQALMDAPVGRPTTHDGQRQTWFVPELAAGTHVHTYGMVVLRPGVCALPPPEIEQGGSALGVEMVPKESRLLTAGE